MRYGMSLPNFGSFGVALVHSEWPKPVETEQLLPVIDIIENERGNLDGYDVVIFGETTGTDTENDREKIQI